MLTGEHSDCRAIERRQSVLNHKGRFEMDGNAMSAIVCEDTKKELLEFTTYQRVYKKLTV